MRPASCSPKRVGMTILPESKGDWIFGFPTSSPSILILTVWPTRRRENDEKSSRAASMSCTPITHSSVSPSGDGEHEAATTCSGLIRHSFGVMVLTEVSAVRQENACWNGGSVREAAQAPRSRAQMEVVNRRAEPYFFHTLARRSAAETLPVRAPLVGWAAQKASSKGVAVAR